VPRILVADDNSNIQKMVALAFEEHGIDVVAVGNGEAAVRRLPDLNPDVVLADVFMPVRNGYEVCEFVKKDPRFCKIPVILLVGAFDPLDEQEARRVGADGVLKKPFVPPDPLIAMVTSALEKAPKPEIKAAAEPVAELPKVVPTAPPPVPEAFPEPTPEEEAYMFGTGRRSLDDDEKTEAAAPQGGAAGAPAAVQTAVEAETEAEEEAKFSGTRADWRRREEVDFAAVPSFSAELVDAPAEARAEASVAHDVAPLVEQRAEAPALEADPFAIQPQVESSMESVVATGAIETFGEAPAAESEEAAAPIVHEPPPVAEVVSVSHQAVVETPTFESPEAVQTAAPVDSAEVLSGKLEESQAPESAPILSAVVDTVTSPRKWLDFLLPSRASRSSEPSPADVVARLEAHSPQTPVEEAPVSSESLRTDAAVAGETAVADASPEAPVATYEAAPAAAVSEQTPPAETVGEARASEDSGQHWSEIASQLAAEAPRVEAAQTAMNVEPSPTSESEAPAFTTQESPVSEAPAPESYASPAETPAATESVALEAPASVTPTIEEVIERASATAAAPAVTPNIDEVVAKILEKLGPQIQEMLAKGVVKPMVEDMLKNPDENKK
jgi:CheY-like chemotaxis protein